MSLIQDIKKRKSAEARSKVTATFKVDEKQKVKHKDYVMEMIKVPMCRDEYLRSMKLINEISKDPNSFYQHT